MGFEVEANPATVRVMRKWVEQAEEEAAESNAFVGAFTEFLKVWSDQAIAQDNHKERIKS